MSLTALSMIAVILVQNIAAAPHHHLTSQELGDGPSHVVSSEITDPADEIYAISSEDDTPKSRVKRQFLTDRALDLASSHRDSSGNHRPVGKLHGYRETNINGNNKDNFNYNSQAGVGAVVYRSENKKHSIGLGAAVNSNSGRSNGQSYSSGPEVAAGASYRFEWGR